MDGVVDFDYTAWALRYPALAAAAAQPLAAQFFAEAGLYCNNSGASLIKDLPTRGLILSMITAHIAALAQRAASAPIVGRINSATEGSVTVQAQFDVAPGSAQWWAQTPYGASAWQAMAPWRTMHYRPGFPRRMSPLVGGYPHG